MQTNPIDANDGRGMSYDARALRDARLWFEHYRNDMPIGVAADVWLGIQFRARVLISEGTEMDAWCVQ